MRIEYQLECRLARSTPPVHHKPKRRERSKTKGSYRYIAKPGDAQTLTSPEINPLIAIPNKSLFANPLAHSESILASVSRLIVSGSATAPSKAASEVAFWAKLYVRVAQAPPLMPPIYLILLVSESSESAASCPIAATYALDPPPVKPESNRSMLWFKY